MAAKTTRIIARKGCNCNASAALCEPLLKTGSTAAKKGAKNFASKG